MRGQKWPLFYITINSSISRRRHTIMTLKQMEVTEKKIGDSTFYIKKFPAFTAANISGELVSVLAPVIGGIAAVAGKDIADGDKQANILDTDIEDALPAFSQAFSSLSGDKFERLMKKLLIDHKNVSVESEVTEGNVKLLTYDLANEVFCGDVQDMFILCLEVIKLNFNGFFKKMAAQFGGLTEALKKAQNTKNGENSTQAASRTSK